VSPRKEKRRIHRPYLDAMLERILLNIRKVLRLYVIERHVIRLVPTSVDGNPGSSTSQSVHKPRIPYLGAYVPRRGRRHVISEPTPSELPKHPGRHLNLEGPHLLLHRLDADALLLKFLPEHLVPLLYPLLERGRHFGSPDNFYTNQSRAKDICLNIRRRADSVNFLLTVSVIQIADTSAAGG